MNKDQNSSDSPAEIIDKRLRDLADRVGRLEEHVSLAVTAPDGSRLSFVQLLTLGLTRRQAIAALGFVAAGATISGAISRSLETVRPGDDDETGAVDADHLTLQSVTTERQRIVDGGRDGDGDEDSEFVWTIETDDLVLEGLGGDFVIQNPKTEIDGEKRAIVYEGGTFESASFVELNYESAEPALGEGAEAGENTVSYGRAAGRANEDQQNVNIGDRAGDGSSGERNAFIGRESGRDADGEENVYIGWQAGQDVMANHNTLVGSRIATESEIEESAGVGQWAVRGAVGRGIHALGRRAGYAADSESSIFIGRSAGEECEANVVYAFGDDAGRGWDEDYTMLVGDDSGNIVLKVDLESGDLELAGELTENVDL